MAYISKYSGEEIDNAIIVNENQNNRLTLLENKDISLLEKITNLENLINEINSKLQDKPNLEILTTNNLSLLRTVTAGTSDSSSYTLEDVVGGKKICVSVSFSGSTHIITLTPKFNLDGYKKCIISGTFGHNYSSALTTTIHAQFATQQITTDSGSWCLLGSTTSTSSSFLATYDISNFTGDNYLNFRCYHGTQTSAYTSHFYITSIVLTN